MILLILILLIRLMPQNQGFYKDFEKGQCSEATVIGRQMRTLWGLVIFTKKKYHRHRKAVRCQSLPSQPDYEHVVKMLKKLWSFGHLSSNVIYIFPHPPVKTTSPSYPCSTQDQDPSVFLKAKQEAKLLLPFEISNNYKYTQACFTLSKNSQSHLNT